MPDLSHSAKVFIVFLSTGSFYIYYNFKCHFIFLIKIYHIVFYIFIFVHTLYVVNLSSSLMLYINDPIVSIEARGYTISIDTQLYQLP